MHINDEIETFSPVANVGVEESCFFWVFYAESKISYQQFFFQFHEHIFVKSKFLLNSICTRSDMNLNIFIPYALAEI